MNQSLAARRCRRLIAAALAAPLALGILSGCGDDDGGRKNGAAAPRPTAGTPSPTSLVPDGIEAFITPVGTPTPEAQATGGGADPDGPSDSGGGTDVPDGPVSPAPGSDGTGFEQVLVQAPDTCKPGDQVRPTLIWKAAGATGITLSVNKAGAGGNSYPASGFETMPAIECTGAAGTVLTERYHLRTVGAKPVGHKTVTVSVTVS